jgi:hypothetical protein
VSSRRRPQRKVSFRKEVLDVSRVQLNLRQRRFLKKCFLARVRRWTLLAGAFQTRTVVAESAWRQWTRHSPSATQPTSEQIRQNKETTIERAPRGHPGTATSASLHGPTTRPRPTLLAMLQEIPRYSAQHLRKEGSTDTLGDTLTVDRISGRLTKVQMYQGTICRVKEAIPVQLAFDTSAFSEDAGG